MSTTQTSVGILRAKAIALAVDDIDRAKRFYKETLGLEEDPEHETMTGFKVGETIILLKPRDEWYGRPSSELNARITLEVRNAHETEMLLRERGVILSDPVKLYDDSPVGSFLDSEGNKLWFCSDR